MSKKKKNKRTKNTRRGSGKHSHQKGHSKSTAAPKKRPSWRMKLALVVFGIVITAVFLGLLEGSLRLLSVATPPPLFIPLAEENGKQLVRNNQLFPERFFFRRYQGKYAGVGETNLQVCWVPKPEDTVRILFIGASTVQGFPQPRNLNAASFLRAFLEDLLPEKRIEVINLGTTALASFPVLKVLEHTEELKPDAVVAYLGHNEFFGAYGVSSIMRAWTSPAGCRLHYLLKQSRIARVLTSFTRDDETPEVTEKDLMEIMAAVDMVAPDDPCREMAYRNLAVNLDAMARIAGDWAVPFIVCSLVSNEKDLVPVRSTVPDGDPDKQNRFQTLLSKGTGQALAEAEAMYDQSALLWYKKAQAFYRDKEFAEAKEAFARAIDLDAMPWRAASDANRIIRSLATQPGVFLARVEAEFRTYSPHEILGNELFLDHVHPTSHGYGLLARAVVKALQNALPDLNLKTDTLASINHYKNLLGDCEVVKLHTARQMAAIFSKQPLNENNSKTAARFNEEVLQITRTLHPAEKEAYKIWKDLPKILMRRPLVMVCADMYRRQIREAKPDSAASARLFEAGIFGTPPYTPLRIEAYANTLKARLAINKKLSAADKELAEEALQMTGDTLKTPLKEPADVKEMQAFLKRCAPADLWKKMQGGSAAR